MAGLHAPRAGLPLKGAAVLMDRRARLRRVQARQASPMLPYGGEAGGAGEARCRKGLRQGSGVGARAKEGQPDAGTRHARADVQAHAGRD